MKVSNIKNVLGGADNVSVIEVINGEQRVWEGAFTNDGAAVDITNFTLEAAAKYFTADIASAGKSYTIDNLTETDPQPSQPSLLIEKKSAVDGTFKFVLPDDIYDGEVAVDASTGIPLVLIFFRYITGADTIPDPQPILMHRLLVIVRAGLGA